MNSELPNFKFCFVNNLGEACQSHPDLTVDKFLPTQSDPECTGYDVRSASVEDLILQPGAYLKIPLGFKMFAPKGWWLNLVPRSGTFAKLHLHPLYGVIDETYENQLIFVAQYLPDANDLLVVGKEKKITFGDRVAQVIPVKRQEMTCEEISEEQYSQETTQRNALRKLSGFGGSGTR